MSEQQRAKPVGYMANPTGIGKTYKCAALKPEPNANYEFTIVEFDDVIGVIEGDRPGIAVEFQDDLMVGEKQVMEEFFKNKDKVYTQEELTHRIAIDLPSARRFCCHLIHTLASTGDEVAIKLNEAMDQILEEMRRSQNE
jgi:hypothetical protein